MKRKVNCTWLFSIFVGTAALALAPPAWAGTGSGTLTVTDDGLCSGTGFSDFDSPNHWDVFQGLTIHINISPGFSICTSPLNTNKTNDPCSVNADCNDTANCTGPSGSKTCNQGLKQDQSCTVASDCTTLGTCASALECSGNTTVYIKGTDGTPCTQDSDCGGTNETTCDTDIGFCKFVDPINTSGRTGNGAIDVCYTTRSDMCLNAKVAYCDDKNDANVNHPQETPAFSPAFLRPVDESDVPIESCSQNLGPDSCTNEVGSFCCGLTQGAYGAPNSVATAAGTGTCGTCSVTTTQSCLTDANCPSGQTCNGATLTGAGFIPAAICQGCNPFTGDPNATTIGIHGTRAVTLNDLATLIAYLPAGGTPKQFNTTGPIAPGTDTHYFGGSIGASQNISGSGSKGNGGGALSGQTMACELNDFLSSCGIGPTGGGSFTASGFGGFELPSAGTLVCTKRSGGDKVLGTDDDVCQAFSYPNCVEGLTVAQVQACANSQLGTGSNSCDCTASELTAALNNINVEFDQCGNVIECPESQTAGVFTCPD